MLGKFRRIPVITLLAVVLLMVAATASQAKLKWSLSGGYNPSTGTWSVTIDVHRITATEALRAQAFGFNLMYPAGTYTGLEFLGPYQPNPPTQIPSPSTTGGLLWIEGRAPQGVPLPEGLGGNVDLARFQIDSFFDVFTELSVSGGWVMLEDGTTEYPDPVTAQFVPEPSSVAALLTGFAGLVGFGIRRKMTS